MVKGKLYYVLGLLVLLSSCYKEEFLIPGEGLTDWDDATHSSSATPNYSLVFADYQVNRFDITISEENWEAMQSDLESIYGSNSNLRGPGGGGDVGGGGSFSDQTPIYVPCDIDFNGTRWYNVGIRYKGNSSLSAYSNGTLKLPFRLKFAEFEDEYPEITGQTFNGFSELSLSSNYNDQSFLREKNACDLFDEFGVPAPQASLLEIYIDYGDEPVFYGVYTMVEVVFDTMLENQFGSNFGNCYKPDGDGAAFATSGFSLDVFENKTTGGTGEDDIQSLYAMLHASSRLSDTTQWKAGMESLFDVDGFLKWLAVNTTIQNWDTYGRMTHNYYLYHDPADGLIKWIPWDNNEAFEEGKQGGALSYQFTEINDTDWPLIGYITGVPGYEKIFKNHIRSFINGPFATSTMQAKYAEYESLLSEYAQKEDRDYSFLSSASDFNSAMSTLNTHVSERVNVAQTYLNE